MRTLIFSPGFPPIIGGQPNYIYARCKALPENLDVLAAKCPGDLEFDAQQEFRIHRFNFHHQPVHRFITPMWRLRKLEQSARILRRFLRNGDYDVLEVSTLYPGGTAAQLLFPDRRFLLISYAHGDEILKPTRSRITAELFRRALRNLDLVVTNSDYSKDLLINAGADEKKIVIIHPPVDFSLFGRFGNPSDFKKSLPDHDLMMLTVCKISKKKNVGSIIQLMPRLIHKFPGLIYLVVGEGNYKQTLEKMAQKSGVADRILFLGRVPAEQLADIYAASDVFVMPTREDRNTGSVEGFGIVFLEAGSQEIPVIGPNRGGSQDAITDKETGFLVNPEDLYDIENRINQLLSDPQLRNVMGQAGRAKALQPTDFSILNDFERSMRPNNSTS